jgi:hypothetical protein
MCIDSLKSFGKTDSMLHVADTQIDNSIVGALMGLDWTGWTGFVGISNTQTFWKNHISKIKPYP